MDTGFPKKIMLNQTDRAGWRFEEKSSRSSGLFFCFCGAWQVFEGAFQADAFGRGRCDRRGKSGGPPLLKLSLQVKRNSAHSQSSAFVVAPVSREHNTLGHRQMP